jgi:hypothetical protein
MLAALRLSDDPGVPAGALWLPTIRRLGFSAIAHTVDLDDLDPRRRGRAPAPAG